MNCSGLYRVCPVCDNAISYDSYLQSYICNKCGYKFHESRAHRVGKFEKVSLEQFKTSIKDEFGACFTDEEIEEMYEKIKLPRRATTQSAGYDFFAPFDFTLHQNEVIKIPTGIRALIDDGWFLACYPRSGQGFKSFAGLANTVAIIDADYSNAKNEGHIFIKMVNRTPYAKGSAELLTTPPLVVKQGQGFAQGIFQPFGITYDDNATGERTGGFGSTTGRG